jgi:hypothetical protein
MIIEAQLYIDGMEVLVSTDDPIKLLNVIGLLEEIEELQYEFDDEEDDGIEYDEDGVAYWYDEDEDVYYYFDEDDEEWYEVDEDEDEDEEDYE